MTSRPLNISLWWCLIIKSLLPKQCITVPQFVAYMLKSYLTLKLTSWPEGSSKIAKILSEKYFSDKITRQRGITLVLALFVRNHIFAYLTLKLTQWPWKLPFIIKIVTDMNYSVKMTSKRRTTLLLLFVLKIIFSHFWPLIDFEMTLSWNWPCTWLWITKIIL